MTTFSSSVVKFLLARWPSLLQATLSIPDSTFWSREDLKEFTPIKPTGPRERLSR